MIKQTVFLLKIIMICLFTTNSSASEKIQIDKFNDWSVLRQETDAGRLCYITSEPIEKKGDYNKSNRGETRVFVTHGPGKAERDVVSIVAGYVFKKQSEVELSVDGNKQSFFTLEDRAWSFGQDEDKKIIRNMKRGNKLTVTGVSSRGNKTIDVYSLSGFTKAKQMLDKICS
ncbi:MAG: invasion associated locus B family protein [Alphaproteobacteria bacterium]